MRHGQYTWLSTENGHFQPLAKIETPEQFKAKIGRIDDVVRDANHAKVYSNRLGVVFPHLIKVCNQSIFLA
jgi:hypothetical protein